MKTLHWTGICALVTVLLILVGCNLPEGNPNLPDPLPGTCNPNELIAPVPESPTAMTLVTGLQPQFDWSYPIYCQPTGYRVEVCSNQGCDTVVASGDVASGQTTWTPATPLAQASEHFWRVAALTVADGEDVLGPWSAHVPFYTGPQCDPAALTAPYLVSPAEGASVDPVDTAQTTPPTFQWSHQADCTAPGHRIQIALTADFAAPVVSHDAENPRSYWRMDANLQEQTVYHWRVARLVDGAPGPWSASRSFITNTIPTGQLAVVAGVVWHDRCFIDWEGGGTPAGCVPGNPYPVANGILEPGEPGIPNVVVSYTAGACGTGWNASQAHTAPEPTSQGGHYGVWLAPGTYCFAIDRGEAANGNIFNGGAWTAPVQGDTFAVFPMTTVTVSAGEERTNVNFGYDFLFGSSVTPARVSGMVWNDLNGDGLTGLNEPGIPWLEIWLTLGGCSSNYMQAPHLTVNNATDGSFLFDYLNPGRYCLVVDPGQHPNFDYLTGGFWTAPDPGDTIQMVALTLAEGQFLSGQDFGWHFSAQGSPTATFRAYPTVGPQLQTPTPYPTLIWMPQLTFMPYPTFPIYSARSPTPTPTQTNGVH
ncbi:MAG: hypothetical protein ABIJ39_02285 [Chloroflexota bacterium]